jgi:Outer membrane protein/protective antigen OMA87
MKIVLVIFVTLTAHIGLAQTNDSVSARIILVGDAGALVNGTHPVVSAIKNYMHPDKKTTIVYLGDNLYKIGLPDEAHVNYVLSRSVLDSQMAVAENTPARVYFIPGNHDWENGGTFGWDALLRQEAYINSMSEKNVHFIPSEGCPGPVEVPLSDEATMIVFDSQWWLHRHVKPGVDWDCECKTESEFTIALSEMLRKNYNKLVILACHHPFMSNGIHGGYFGLKQHVFPLTDWRKKLYIPLPVIGSIYPISRSVFGSHQDMNYPAYQNMIDQVQKVAKDHPHLIYATGHDHSLQLLKDTLHHYIVSGSGCQTSRVEDSRRSIFTRDSMGYAVVEVSKNKHVRVKFYVVDHTTAVPREAFSDMIIDFSKLPPLAPDTVTQDIPKYEDFYTAPASNQYKKASRLKRAILGNNYREVWSQPVKLKVFRLNEEHGGFKIESMGGGKQTKTLTLVDKQVKKWALRTIDKDPEAAVPENLRGTIANDIVQDMISAAHPYAPLVVDPLQTAAGIPHAKPSFYLVPDDPAFGYYRPLFANKVCMLEEKDASWDGSDTKSSITVFNNMIEDNDHRVRQKEALRARLMDLLIADWDRHMDQWKFGKIDSGKSNIYYPIPKDRDQAMFYSDGMLLAYLSRRRMPFLKGFRYNIPRPSRLATWGKDFDRLWLTNIDRTTWDSVTRDFTAALSDTVIKTAVAALPPEIAAIDGRNMTEKLISRRNELHKASMKYYQFLAEKVNVLGSNKTEYFSVTNEGNKIRVQVRPIKDKGQDTGAVMYDRIFDPKETDEIRLYGFRGNDRFYIDANAKRRILVRVIGGKGDDSFHINGNIRNYIYDLNTEKNYLARGSRTRSKLSNDPRVNDYDFNEFQYNQLHFPRINIGFNPDDGFFLGAGAWYRRQAFRKKPYASDQRFGALFALTEKAYQLRYRGIFTNVFPKTDIVVNAEHMDPNLSNFFGFGNETVREKDSAIKYYRVRYKNAAADVLFRRILAGGALSLFAGPSVYHYWNKRESNKDYILSQPSLVGLDSLEIYSVKTYLGGKAGILLNNLNNELWPTRGIYWLTTYTHMAGMNHNSSQLSKLESDMVVYASLNNPARWVTVLRLGAGKIFSDKLEYFQALNLGANNYLRGFRKNRFSGQSLAYGSLEFRFKLFDSKSYILPGQVGLVAFNDIGRVWLKGETSKKWHYAYGGGLYYVPFSMVLVSATMAFSREESLFNFTIGTKLNLTF